MKEIIAIINQKGGVGKSTTALALGAGILLKGYKALFIDLDPQGNLTYSLGADPNKPSILEVILNDSAAREAIQQTKGGDVIPASPALAGADAIIINTGKEYRLKEALEPLRKEYDYIIIDTPPALGILTVNALTVATGAVIPAQADIFSLQGINQLYDTIQAVKQYCNPSLKIKGIALTRYNARAILNREVAEAISETAKRLDTRLYKSTIREGIALREAQANQQDIFSYAPRSNVAKDYHALINEILEEE